MKQSQHQQLSSSPQRNKGIFQHLHGLQGTGGKGVINVFFYMSLSLLILAQPNWNLMVNFTCTTGFLVDYQVSPVKNFKKVFCNAVRELSKSFDYTVSYILIMSVIKPWLIMVNFWGTPTLSVRDMNLWRLKQSVRTSYCGFHSGGTSLIHIHDYLLFVGSRWMGRLSQH